MNRNATLRLLVACGTAVAVSSLAHAQVRVINISGATLQQNFLQAQSATNDFIDANLDTVSFVDGSPLPQQLADQQLPVLLAGPFPALPFWAVHYRATGSVNGLTELAAFGAPVFLTNADGPTQPLSSSLANPANWNRQAFIQSGVPGGPISGSGVAANPGRAPSRTLTDGSYLASGTTGGVQIDIAPLDTPVTWSIQGPAGLAFATAKPGQAGYGRNPRVSVNKNGTVNGLPSLLSAISGRNINLATPDSNTIYDTFFAYAPVAASVNLGVGRSQIDKSDLQHLFVTGRLKSGENLVCVTRDVGSGTRNAFVSTIGIDPAWGVGENVGGLSVTADLDTLGPTFQPGNKSASGGVDRTVGNHRLAIGQSGAERAVQGGAPGSWGVNGFAEVLAVRNDVAGGTVFARPSIANVLNNGVNGYSIAGPAVFATIGDPLSAPAVNGGLGWRGAEVRPATLNPAMANNEAAAFINNITRSLAAFSTAPTGNPLTAFTPGGLVANTLVPLNAPSFLPDLADPTNLLPNPNINTNVRTYVQNNNALRLPFYTAFGSVTLNGRVPSRVTGNTYSDGVSGPNNFYVTQGGANLTYATPLNNRNRVAGDFDGNALRNINDTFELVRAFRNRLAPANPNFAVWPAPNGSGAIAGAPGADASIEILGDFDGDGNFTSTDVRYFADGLALQAAGPNAGKLDRNAAFTALDNAWFAQTGSDNFFGTTLATGKPYIAGGSRGDVSNASKRVARGWAPIGATADVANANIIDANDIDYVFAQFKSVSNPLAIGNAVNWAGNLPGAALADLSCDITGDLVIDQADADSLVKDILQTCFGDVNLDGVVDVTDFNIANANVGLPGPFGWAQGDMNGDLVVDALDIGIIQAGCAGVLRCNPADIADNGSNPGSDGCVDNGDFSLFISQFFNAGTQAGCTGATIPCAASDIADNGSNPGPDGFLDNGDFSLFISSFFGANCTATCAP
jgi:hypothetical protein